MILENRSKKVKWVLVKTPTKSNLEYLNERFGIDKNDLSLVLPPFQRPRIVKKEKYIVMILHFPYYNRTTKEIKTSEVDFFIGKDFLITVTDGKLPPLLNLFDDIEDPDYKNKHNLKDNMGNLLYEILHSLLIYLGPMLNHIAQDLDQIEDKIKSQTIVKKEYITDILTIKTNIINFRKTIQSHKNVIKKLIIAGSNLFNPNKLRPYFNELIEYTVEIWSTLENYTYTINALHDTYESMVTFKINQIMKVLTLFSVIVFPLTLLAAIFGMNTVNMPLVDSEYGFWVIIGIMLAGSAVMWGYFKHKKWI